MLDPSLIRPNADMINAPIPVLGFGVSESCETVREGPKDGDVGSTAFLVLTSSPIRPNADMTNAPMPVLELALAKSCEEDIVCSLVGMPLGPGLTTFSELVNDGSLRNRFADKVVTRKSDATVYI